MRWEGSLLIVLALSVLDPLLRAASPQKLAIPAETHYLAEARTVPSLPAILQKPDGDGPFPGVVMLCGCGGYADQSSQIRYFDWAKRLADWGYAALLLDSFTPRGYPGGICDRTEQDLSPVDRANDAYAGKSYLENCPFVDKNHLFVIGWSHGGWAIMKIIDESLRNKDVAPFKAGVAFYPYCSPLRQPDTPVLVLIGEKDDWCPAALAKEMETAYKNNHWQPEFALTVYPDATHHFDNFMLRKPVTVSGHRLNYNQPAARDAYARTQGFLAKYRAIP